MKRWIRFVYVALAVMVGLVLVSCSLRIPLHCATWFWPNPV